MKIIICFQATNTAARRCQSEASDEDATEDNIMRTMTKAVLALGFVGAMAIGTTASVEAQGIYLNVPGVHIGVGGPGYRRHYRDAPRYYDQAPGYGYGSNCPPNYTVQDGVCKPYRGY